jgi:hypothetical protein
MQAMSIRSHDIELPSCPAIRGDGSPFAERTLDLQAGERTTDDVVDPADLVPARQDLDAIGLAHPARKSLIVPSDS